MNDQAYNALQQYLQQTLNPATQKNGMLSWSIDNPTHKYTHVLFNTDWLAIAERQLAEVEVQQGFPILLLKLINDNNVEMVLRFAGSLYFKNYVKRHWVPVSRYEKKTRCHTYRLLTPLVH